MNLHDPTIGELNTTERKRKGEFSLSLLQLRCPSFLPSVIKALGSQAFGLRLWITPQAPLVFRPLDLNYTTSFYLFPVCRQTVKFMNSITTWTNSYNKSPHIYVCVYICVYTYSNTHIQIYISEYILLILFLWRTLTYKVFFGINICSNRILFNI